VTEAIGEAQRTVIQDAMERIVELERLFSEDNSMMNVCFANIEEAKHKLSIMQTAMEGYGTKVWSAESKRERGGVAP